MYDLPKQCTSLAVNCAAAFWIERASSLGAIIARAAHRPAAIDVFSNCWPAGTVVDKRGVTIRTRSGVDARLLDARKFAAFQHIPKNQWPHVRCILKWAVVAIADAEFVFYADLDVIVITPRMEAVPSLVASEWLAVFERMRARNLRLLTGPDGASPLNGGIMILRPDRAIYAEGLALLLKANSSFNTSHGWGLRGPPQAVVPKTDGLWRGHPPQLQRFSGRKNAWTFYAAGFDQGFFFYMFRVKHRLGADLLLEVGPLDPLYPVVRKRRGVWCLPHASANKPYQQVPDSPGQCPPMRGKREPDKQVRNKLVRYGSFFTEGLAAIEHGQTAKFLVGSAMLERCTVGWRHMVRCTRTAALLLMNESDWAAVEAAPIDTVISHRKCCPRCESAVATLWLTTSQ